MVSNMAGVDVSVSETIVEKDNREVWKSIRRGISSKCARCNKGKVFKQYLKFADSCNHCGQEFHHHRADDFPPYIAITIVGHIVLSLAVSVQVLYNPVMWVHLSLWIPLIVILSLVLLPPIKGGLLGLQWALRLHDFENDDHSPKYDEESDQTDKSD